MLRHRTLRRLPVERERGAALLIVLLFAALLAGLTGVVLQGATSGARAAAVFLDAMRADDLGRGAADAVAYAVVTGGPPERRGGAFAIHLDQADIEVAYRSESARVDLNKAPADLILAVLAAAGADAGTLADVRARLAGRPDSTVTPPVVLAAATATPAGSIGAAAAPLPRAGSKPVVAPADDVLQAMAPWNLPADVAARALPAFTIANGTPKVDPVLAGPLVLAALMGGEGTRVDDFIERRLQGFVDTEAALALLPIEARGFAGFADVSAVRATVLVTIAHRFRRRYEIVLDPPAFPGEAPHVLSWRPLF